MNMIDDAEIVIRKEKVEESKRSESSGSLYNYLLSYC